MLLSKYYDAVAHLVVAVAPLLFVKMALRGLLPSGKEMFPSEDNGQGICNMVIACVTKTRWNNGYQVPSPVIKITPQERLYSLYSNSI